MSWRITSVGRRDEADIDRNGLAPADALHRSLLHHTQEGALRLWTQPPDFIEQEGPVLRPFKDALMPSHGPGERPSFVA